MSELEICICMLKFFLFYPAVWSWEGWAVQGRLKLETCSSNRVSNLWSNNFCWCCIETVIIFGLLFRRNPELWLINKPLQWEKAQRRWASAMCSWSMQWLNMAIRKKVELNVKGTREVPFFRLTVVSVGWINWLYQLGGSAGCVNFCPWVNQKSVNVFLSYPDQHGGSVYVAQLKTEYNHWKTDKKSFEESNRLELLKPTCSFLVPPSVAMVSIS